MNRAAAACADRLEQPWARQLFLEFHAGLDPARTPGGIVRRIPRHLAFFQTIERGRPDPASLTQACLLDLFGADGLRRMETVTVFLVGRLGLRWDEAASRNHPARVAIDRMLAQSDAEPWGADLRRFHSTLMQRGVAARTAKVYLTAATGVMRHAGVASAMHLTRTNVNGWLHFRRGHAASLGRFLSWIASEGGPRLTAHGRPKNPARKRERAVLRRAKTLVRLLDSAGSDTAFRSLLARIGALALGVPLESLLDIRSTDIDRTPDGVALHIPGIGKTMLPGWLGEQFLTAVAGRDGALFPGRTGFRPRSVDGTRYHATTPAADRRIGKPAAALRHHGRSRGLVHADIPDGLNP